MAAIPRVSRRSVFRGNARLCAAVPLRAAARKKSYKSIFCRSLPVGLPSSDNAKIGNASRTEFASRPKCAQTCRNVRKNVVSICNALIMNYIRKPSARAFSCRLSERGAPPCVSGFRCPHLAVPDSRRKGGTPRARLRICANRPLWMTKR